MRYLIVDLEGTCCNDGSIPKNESETIEIGAAIVAKDTWEIITSISLFVRPVRHPTLTPFCTELTGIEQNDVEFCDTFPTTFEQFCQWGVGFDTIYSWGPYDKLQLDQDCRYWQIEQPFKHFDLSKRFTQLTGKKRGHRQAMRHFGLKEEGRRHRGLQDVKNIIQMLPMLLS